MAGTPETVRIFISSPSDVRPERLIAERIVERLDREFGSLLHAKAFLWEREPLVASRHPQDPDNIPLPSTMDIVVVIMWSRLGVTLPDDKRGAVSKRTVTGTEFEFEDALASALATSPPKPDLLFYRKTAEPIAGLGDLSAAQQMIAQFELVGDFISRWFHSPDLKKFLAPLHPFANTAEFEGLIYDHLQALLKKRITRTNKEKRWHPPPFRGLQSFEYEHAQIFFGRTRARNELREILARQVAKASAFVLVLGASGSGKSSLIKAGLLPDLMLPGMIGRVALCRRGAMRPADAPEDLMRALALAILSPNALPELAGLRYTADRLAGLFRDAPTQATLPIEQGLAQAGKAEHLTEIGEARLVLVVDQLEELFTIQSIDEAQRGNFVRTLAALARSGLVWVLATMRSDFFNQLVSLPELAELASPEARYLLHPPDGAEIGQIIRGPAAEAGLQFEHDEHGIGLDERILQAASRRGALPLLSFLLDQLWQKRGENDTLTFEAHRALGGLEGALGNHATQVFQKQPPEVQAALPRVLRALVTVSSSAANEATARTISKQLFGTDSPEGKLVRCFLDPDARLLIAEGDDAAGAARIRVTHEALLTHWDRAREQIAIDRGELELKTRLELAAGRWKNHKEEQRDTLLLSPGLPLSEASDLIARRRDECDGVVIEYVESSIAAEEARLQREHDLEQARLRREQEHAAERRRLELAQVEAAQARARLYRIFAAVAGVLLAFAVAGGLYAWEQRSVAASASAQAQENYEIALDQAAGSVALLKDSYDAGGISTTLMQQLIQKAETTLQSLPGETDDVTAARAQLFDVLSLAYLALGDVKNMQKFADDGLHAAAGLVAKAPGNPRWRRLEAAAHGRLSDVLYWKGDPLGAVKEGRAGRDIMLALVAQQPNDADLQRDLTDLYRRIGEGLDSMGSLDEARASYQAWLDVASAALAKNADDPKWSASVAYAYREIGDTFLQELQPMKAAPDYQQSRQISLRLLASDPHNSSYLYTVSAVGLRVGDALLAQDATEDALKQYQEAEKIAQMLEETESKSYLWRELLQAAYQRIGDADLHERHYDDALKEFQIYLQSSLETQAIVPDNGSARYEVANAYQKIGDVQREQGKLDDALKAYRSSLQIAIDLDQMSFWNGAWKKLLAMDHQRIGMVYELQGNSGSALGAFQECLKVSVNKFVWSPRTLWPADVTDFCRQNIATLGGSPPR
jgi:tetratricopeptide (TPR) repeat protein